jgi:hypothetical protein
VRQNGHWGAIGISIARLAAPILSNVLCLMITPLMVRLTLLHAEGIRLQRHDVKWLISALAVVFGAVGLFSLIPKGRRFPFFATISVLWTMVHYANYETYLALGGILQLAFLPLLFDPTFFVGSATHVSRPILLIASLPSRGVRKTSSFTRGFLIWKL